MHERAAQRIAVMATPATASLAAGITLIDTATAIAERIVSVRGRPTPVDSVPKVRVLSTGNASTMRLLLEQCPSLADIEVESLDLSAAPMVPETGIEPVRPLSRGGGF